MHVVKLLCCLLIITTYQYSFANDPQKPIAEEIQVVSRPAPLACNLSESYIDDLIKDFNIVLYDAANAGHTSKKHISVNLQALSSQFEHNKRLNVVSSYKSQEIAERVIKQGLLNDKKRIVNWINAVDSLNSIKLEYNTSIPIGYYVSRSNYQSNPDILLEASNAAIVLRKKPNECSFVILTSYPVVPESQKYDAQSSSKVKSKKGI
jgi:Bacterial CdiA-CT RNAse A domain